MWNKNSTQNCLDTHILGSTSTMDPSQMFINNSSPAHSFDFDASSLGHNDDIVDTKELVSLQSGMEVFEP